MQAFFRQGHTPDSPQRFEEERAMRRLIPMVLMAAALLGGGSALAAPCSKEDFGQAVDRAGSQLRKLNAEQIPQVQAKVRKLKEMKGWADDKAYETLQDERMAAFDA